MSTLLAIDPGFTRLGYALFVGPELKQHGVTGITRADNEPWLSYLNRGICHFWDWYMSLTANANPDILVFEALSPSAPGPQVPLVFTASAVLKVLAFEDDTFVEDVAASAWKAELNLPKKVTKAQTRRFVLEQFPDVRGGRKLQEIPADETDAIAIGIAYRSMNATS